MRKNLLKTLFVAAGMVMGVNGAWADEITATLVHTASSSSAGTAGVFTSTVDAENEHVNNTNFAAAWAAAAYAEFSFDIPEGHAIESATLTFTGLGESRNTRNTDVLYAGADQSLDYDVLKAGNANVNLTATRITSVTFPKGATATKEFTVNATDAVKAMIEADKSGIIFKFTGNPGGGDLKGKGSDVAPTLIITTVSASSQTKYTVKFTDADNNELKEAVTYDVIIGNEVTASADNMAAFKNADGTTKYVYVSGNETIQANEDATANVITLVFREASIYNYSVVSSQGGVVNSGSTFEGETLSVGYPHYQLIDGTLYAAAANNKEYSVSMTVNEDNTSATVTYNQNAENIIFYSEAEDIEGLENVTYGNVAIRASKALAAKAIENKVITTLPAGKYVVAAGVFSSAKTPNYIIKIGVGNEIFEAPVTVVNASEVKSGEFNVPAGTTVTLYAEGMGDNNALDYIYIQKTGEYEAVDVTPFVGNHLVDVTVTGNNVTAEFKGRTIKVEAGAEAGTVNILLPATEWKGHSMAQTELNGVVVSETENTDVYSLNVVGQKINVDDTEFTVTESAVTYKLGTPAILNAVIKATSDKGDIEVVYNTAATVDVTPFVGEYLVDATVTGANITAEFMGQTIKVEAGAEAGTVNITLPAADYKTHSMSETVINGVRLTDMGEGKYGMSGDNFKVTVDDTEFTANMNVNDNYFEVVDGNVTSLTTNIPATSAKGNITVKYQLADPDAIVAVEVVEVSAPAKRVVNGQIVIEKNGVLYGIDGIRK